MYQRRDLLLYYILKEDMFNFKKFFEKEQWGLVKTFTVNGRTTTAHKTKDVVLYIHLFESNKSSRKYEVGISGDTMPRDDLDDCIKSFDLYQNKVYRWLNGRSDPDIPRYDQISEEDTYNALKGSINGSV